MESQIAERHLTMRMVARSFHQLATLDLKKRCPKLVLQQGI